MGSYPATLTALAQGNHAYAGRVAEHRCAECGEPWPAGQPRCRACGSDRETAGAEIAQSLGLQGRLSYIARGSNAANARVVEFEQAIGEIDMLMAQNAPINKVQTACKRALEAIHELEDSRRDERKEWEQTGWTVEQRGIWAGLNGIRGASHHESVPIVARHGGDNAPADPLVWQLDQPTIAKIPSEDQRGEYRNRIEDQPVLPMLREMLTLLFGAVQAQAADAPTNSQATEAAAQ